jgi:hypothetical protein
MQQPRPVPAPSPQIDPTRLPPDQRTAQTGDWLAFSLDGRTLIARSSALKDLDAMIRAAGEDPEEVLLDWIPFADAVVSGADLS